ncbi:MAG: HEAT repeat domain-containing protein, partial [Planctomycetota bacterium]
MLCSLWITAGLYAQSPTPAAPAVRIAPDATVESLFTDFLHYARVGRFTAADAYAKALLAHPDLDPVKLLEIADRDRDAVQTLVILIRNSSIGDSAAKVLDVLHKGEQERRKSGDRIRRNIELLGGDPQQEHFARVHLRDSGEYAVPYLIQTLLDPDKAQLHPRIISALPFLGKPAVRPLVMALSMHNDDVRLHVIDALGQIGYPQAVPYLRKLIE